MIDVKSNSETITTLTDLTSSLSDAERTTFGSILSKLELIPEELASLGSWSKEKYMRNCIFDSDEFELILLCWEAGQTTPIHDHGGEECWVYVVNGIFKETIFTKNFGDALLPSKSVEVNPGEMTYMIDFMGYHELKNISNERSMTLHLYAKPIRSCNILEVETGNCVPRDLTYDTKIQL